MKLLFFSERKCIFYLAKAWGPVGTLPNTRFTILFILFFLIIVKHVLWNNRTTYETYCSLNGMCCKITGKNFSLFPREKEAFLNAMRKLPTSPISKTLKILLYLIYGTSVHSDFTSSIWLYCGTCWHSHVGFIYGFTRMMAKRSY